MAKVIYCTVSNTNEAEGALNQLQSAGFSSRDISVLFSDPSQSQKYAHEKHTKAPEGAATGAGTGGVIGGILGWLAGIGSLAIPGLGPFIAAGPIMGLLSGAGVGAAVGGLIGGLVGVGIPEYEAKQLEKKVKQGNVLIAVHAETTEEVKHAKEVLKDIGAQDIAETDEILSKDQGGISPQPERHEPLGTH